jgi:hypothetical protein
MDLLTPHENWLPSMGAPTPTPPPTPNTGYPTFDAALEAADIAIGAPIRRAYTENLAPTFDIINQVAQEGDTTLGRLTTAGRTGQWPGEAPVAPMSEQAQSALRVLGGAKLNVGPEGVQAPGTLGEITEPTSYGGHIMKEAGGYAFQMPSDPAMLLMAAGSGMGGRALQAAELAARAEIPIGPLLPGVAGAGRALTPELLKAQQMARAGGVIDAATGVTALPSMAQSGIEQIGQAIQTGQDQGYTSPATVGHLAGAGVALGMAGAVGFDVKHVVDNLVPNAKPDDVRKMLLEQGLKTKIEKGTLKPEDVADIMGESQTIPIDLQPPEGAVDEEAPTAVPGEVITPPAPVEAPPVMEPEPLPVAPEPVGPPVEAEPEIDLTGAGTAIADNLYQSIWDRLQTEGKPSPFETHPAREQRVLEAFDRGEVG